ncbi:MAG: reverse transcriptase-like protein [Desulfobacterales bacterium]|nr:MAG: reverse transcriptase-like protein [Desulfobacterales bacterium]
MKLKKKPSNGKAKTETGEWQRMWFKTNKVWMAVDSKGAPLIKDGKVLIKYQLKQDYEYWVNSSKVAPIESRPEKTPSQHERKNRKKITKTNDAAGDGVSWDETACKDKICVFTDGASAGNPGPAGIGVLLRYGKHEKEISEYIGDATNNIAELKAIQAGLSAVKNTAKPVRLFTDSKYAYGLLVLNWRAHKNQQLVASIKETMAKFKDLKIMKVKGHAGLQENERADRLATSAIKKAAKKRKARQNERPGPRG